MGSTADEGSFIELLIANERVQGWLNEIATLQAGNKRLQTVLKEMAEAVTSREAYAEEARKLGSVPKLTSLLKRSNPDDETSLDLLSSILAACSGPMASGVRVRTISYQGTPITVKEGALGDGVGAKVWTVAHTLCQEMVEHPSIVQGCSVLEIGAGCGPCGLLAAKLGATEVDISDYVDQLLLNLRDALHLNGFELTAATTANERSGDGAGAVEKREEICGEEVEFDESWDPEEDGGSECSDLDAFFGEALAKSGDSAAAAAWEIGPVAVRFLDWKDSVIYLSKQGQKNSSDAARESISDKIDAAGPGTVSDANEEKVTGSYCALDGVSSRSVAPGIPASKQYDVILGTDILYEWAMAESVAAAVAHRLRPGGRALICNAVRDQKMFDALIANMRLQGLRVGVIQIEPRQEDGGVAPHDQPYEGGFVLVAVEHAAAPGSDWHRDDLFPGLP